MIVVIFILAIGVVLLASWWVDRCWKIEHRNDFMKPSEPPPVPKAVHEMPASHWDDLDRRIRGYGPRL